MRECFIYQIIILMVCLPTIFSLILQFHYKLTLKLYQFQQSLHHKILMEQNSKLQQSLEQITEQVYIVRKQREQQRDQALLQQWRQARNRFFTQTVRQSLKQTCATEQDQDAAMVRILDSCRKNKIIYDQSNVQQSMLQLQKQFNDTQKMYQCRQKECFQLNQIIKLQYSTLKVIDIAYQLKSDDRVFSEYWYSVSAFDFFKIIHNNKLLSSVTLKGVNILQLKQFINLLNAVKNNKPIQQEKQQLSWMMNFNPSQSLKLTMDTKIQFDIYKQKEAICQIDDFSYFIRIILWLSDEKRLIEYLQAIICQLNLHIHCLKHSLFEYFQKAKINLGSSTNAPVSAIYDLWQHLRRVQKIKIMIFGGQIPFKQGSMIRSILFGQLSLFTSITQLVFYNLNFDQISLNNYLAIEQSLNVIFRNNPIINLKLQSCNNLPIFPSITTLQLFQSNIISFRNNKPSFINEMIQSNPQLRAVNHSSWRHQVMNLDGKHFEQLETLTCGQELFTVNSIPQRPSSIKHLSFYQSKEVILIFPQLFNLIFLSMCATAVPHQAICAIPSPHLKHLSLVRNGIITDEGLQLIDEKWPYLQFIRIKDCRRVTEKVWRICKFKGLMEIHINQKYGPTRYPINDLKRRGIKVDN